MSIEDTPFVSPLFHFSSLTSMAAKIQLAMALQNRAPKLSVLALSFFFLIISLSPRRSSGQSAPAFACDVGTNPAVAGFGFCDSSLDFKSRVEDLVKRLTLQEKIGFLINNAGSVSRLGIPKYEWWSEALHGVSYVGPGTKFSNVVPGATSFPQVILTAASFNASLFEAIGKLFGSVSNYWSPNVNIFRDPRWGRGQETPGEDPLLSSKYAAGYVRGLQQRDDGDPDRLKVAACCKHYTAYDLDNWKGTDRYHFNAVVNAQDLEDTFQPPFKSCVIDGNVASVMCSYNQVNGKPTCADPDLLAGVIRGEWKLNGYIVSDCDSVDVLYNSQHYTKSPEEAAAKTILAGLDLDCGDFLGKHTEAAVKAGLVNETAIDKAVTNNFLTLMRLGFFDGNPSKQLYGKLGPKDVCTAEHQELAREAARQGIVLLKNSPGCLPLSSSAIKSLAVIGPNANVTKTMIGNYEGTPCKYTTPLQGLSAVVSTSYQPGCANVACTSAQLDEAKKIAASADATVLVVGSDQSIEAESRDRVDLNLPGQQPLLISEVARAAKGPVILVIMTGGGMDVTFAKNDDKITSILWVGFPGEAGGAAIADVIFGSFNPSETVYSFGDGLSYSDYKHHLVRAPKLVSIPLEEGHSCRSSKCHSLNLVEQSCQNLGFDVHLRVTNVGQRSGSHTVFLYSSPPSVHNSPQKHLLGFEKVSLGAGGESVVRFKVDVCKDLSVTDEIGSRKIALGLHVLHVGTLKHSLNVRI